MTPPSVEIGHTVLLTLHFSKLEKISESKERSRAELVHCNFTLRRDEYLMNILHTTLITERLARSDDAVV